MAVSEMEAARALLELKRGMGLPMEPAVATRPRRKGVTYSDSLRRDCK